MLFTAQRCNYLEECLMKINGMQENSLTGTSGVQHNGAGLPEVSALHPHGLWIGPCQRYTQPQVPTSQNLPFHQIARWFL